MSFLALLNSEPVAVVIPSVWPRQKKKKKKKGRENREAGLGVPSLLYQLFFRSIQRQVCARFILSTSSNSLHSILLLHHHPFFFFLFSLLSIPHFCSFLVFTSLTFQFRECAATISIINERRDII